MLFVILLFALKVKFKRRLQLIRRKWSRQTKVNQEFLPVLPILFPVHSLTRGNQNLLQQPRHCLFQSQPIQYNKNYRLLVWLGTWLINNTQTEELPCSCMSRMNYDWSLLVRPFSNRPIPIFDHINCCQAELAVFWQNIVKSIKPFPVGLNEIMQPSM